MPYQELPIDGFGGLNLADDPEEVGLSGAVDLLNVDVTSRGRLVTRRGTDGLLNGPAGSVDDSTPSAVTFTPQGHILVGWQSATPRVASYATGGAGITSTGLTTQMHGRFVKYGTPGNPAVYFAYSDGGGEGIAKYEASVISGVVTSVPVILHLAVSPVDNRLVYAEFDGRVRFSDPGDPTTFGTNNYVDLDPGDGEQISGMETWRDQIFVFKETKFFRFYGTSTSGTGTPVFNYAPVRAGVGALRAVAARDGVYFLASDGVYRTTGGDPQKVSGAIDPYFFESSLPLFTSATPGDFTPNALEADARFVYVRLGDRSFVYDIDSGGWTVYDLPIMSVAYSSDFDYQVLGLGTGKVVKFGADYTDDDGSAIDWLYRSGASDLGVPVEKLVKQAQVWGTGTVTANVYTDHGSTDAGSTALTLGTSPAVARGQQFYSRKGTFFSVGLSGSGPAVIHRAALGVAEQRLAGVG